MVDVDAQPMVDAIVHRVARTVFLQTGQPLCQLLRSSHEYPEKTLGAPPLQHRSKAISAEVSRRPHSIPPLWFVCIRFTLTAALSRGPHRAPPRPSLPHISPVFSGMSTY